MASSTRPPQEVTDGAPANLAVPRCLLQRPRRSWALAVPLRRHPEKALWIGTPGDPTHGRDGGMKLHGRLGLMPKLPPEISYDGCAKPCGKHDRYTDVTSQIPSQIAVCTNSGRGGEGGRSSAERRLFGRSTETVSRFSQRRIGAHADRDHDLAHNSADDVLDLRPRSTCGAAESPARCGSRASNRGSDRQCRALPPACRCRAPASRSCWR